MQRSILNKRGEKKWCLEYRGHLIFSHFFIFLFFIYFVSFLMLYFVLIDPKLELALPSILALLHVLLQCLHKYLWLPALLLPCLFCLIFSRIEGILFLPHFSIISLTHLICTPRKLYPWANIFVFLFYEFFDELPATWCITGITGRKRENNYRMIRSWYR